MNPPLSHKRLRDQGVDKMSRIIIDLSGQEGLVDRYFGDLPYTTSMPQYSYQGGPSQYASGVVNPIAHYGYLAPANGTFTSVSNITSSPPTQVATQIDEVNSFVIFYGTDGYLRRTTSLTQTSLTAGTVNVTNASGTDLQIYSVGGIRKLFFAYKTAVGGFYTTGDIGVWDLHGVTSTNVNGDQLFVGYTGNSGTFVTGDTVTGGSSGATGHISANRYAGGGIGTLFLTSITGTFTNAETLTDGHAHTGSASIPPNSSVLTNFMSTYVSGGTTLSGSNARMVVADNGYMYIIDGPFVHKYDGTSLGVTDVSTSAFGVMTPDVLQFPPGFTLTDAIDLRGKLWITLFQSTRDIYSSPTNTSIESNYCGVYIWDRITTGTSTADFIPVPGVREIRAIVIFQGVPTLFTVSSSRYAEVRMWNGSYFKLVAQLGPEAYPRFHDSVSINGEMMVWLGNDGKIYHYGQMIPGSKNYLWMLGDATTAITNSSTFSNAGALVLAGEAQSGSAGDNLTPQAYYLNISDNTPASKILQWFPHAQNPGGTGQNANAGNYFSVVKALPKLAQTHYLTLFFPPVGSGGATTLLSVNLYVNQSTTAWNGSAIAITANDALRGYKTIPFNVTGVNFVQIGIVYPTSVAISLIPIISYAALDYTPTTKII